MKKTLFSIAIVALSAIVMAACNNKGTTGAAGVEGANSDEPTGTKVSLCAKTYEADTLMLSCDFWYPDNAGMREIEEYDTFNARKTLVDSTENVKFKAYLAESSTYPSHKQSAKENYPESYKEFKVGGYDAFAYDSNKKYTVEVLLENISETTDRYLEIEVDQLMMKSDGPGGKEFFEQNEKVKSIVNSIKYNGAVKKTMELQ